MRSPVLMGIVNVTPDSFSDGGRYLATDAAVAHGARLFAEGAAWLDVGGESTRPGAAPVDPKDEAARVVPVIAGLREAVPDAVISVDTRRALVAEAALDAGASIVNDVSALEDPGMAPLVAERGVEVVLMHMRGDPSTMQRNTRYADLLGEVEAHLLARVAQLRALGVPDHRILLDPGVGFGKAPGDNPSLIAAVPRLKAHGHRVLIGASRKRFIGELTGVSTAAERVFGSVGAALAAAARGADVLRVHDVAATRQALAVFLAVEHA
ncbi:MAG: dihydropteroate synthase [Deltaproteobacteria bacterium]|nr:MAG: dihydropteroate synthase [Deltaproteobacteria bacterium]